MFFSHGRDRYLFLSEYHHEKQVNYQEDNNIFCCEISIALLVDWFLFMVLLCYSRDACG